MTVPGTAAHGAGAADGDESLHRYPVRAVLLDYLYSTGGLLLTLGPLAGAGLTGPAVWFFAALAALFAVFAARTVLRHRTRLRVGADGLAVESPIRRRLPWDELARCTLRYYATRRNRDGGWMQLTLKARRRSLWIDVGLTRCAFGYDAARRNRAGGRMRLTLKARRRSVRIDSQIQGFDLIVRRAVRAAAGNGLAFDRVTTENLRALGISPGARDGG